MRAALLSIGRLSLSNAQHCLIEPVSNFVGLLFTAHNVACIATGQYLDLSPS